MNLALEQVLAKRTAPGERVLLFWVSDPAVVFGRFQNPWAECHLERLDRSGVLPARRMSGGGTVYHDTGNLNYSVITERNTLDIEANLGIFIRVLRAGGITAARGPRRDLFLDNRKISGSAFQLHRDFAIHHGTLLVHTDLAQMQQLLGPALEISKSHGVASVPSSVANIGEVTGMADIRVWVSSITAGFERAWGRLSSFHPTELPAEDELATEASRFADWEWIFGQTPAFELAVPGVPEWVLGIERGRLVSGDTGRAGYKN